MFVYSKGLRSIKDTKNPAEFGASARLFLQSVFPGKSHWISRGSYRPTQMPGVLVDVDPGPICHFEPYTVTVMKCP